MKTTSYQELSQELDDILTKFQTNELSIDEALVAYERGTKITKQLRAQLETAQNQVVELQAKLDD